MVSFLHHRVSLTSEKAEIRKRDTAPLQKKKKTENKKFINAMRCLLCTRTQLGGGEGLLKMTASFT